MAGSSDVEERGVSEFFTVAEVAKKFKMSPRTVHDRVSSGAWPHKKFGDRIIRFTEQQVQKISDMADVPVSGEKKKPGQIKDLVSQLR